MFEPLVQCIYVYLWLVLFLLLYSKQNIHGIIIAIILCKDQMKNVLIIDKHKYIVQEVQTWAIIVRTCIHIEYANS
jgi:hypothetical protein